MTHWLRNFVDIRKNEIGPTALFFFLWFTLILVFQVLRPLKKGLFVNSLGAKVELYAKLANIGVALLLVIVFSLLYNRLGSRRMIAVLCAGFFVALCLFGVVFAQDREGTLLNWVFYLFGDAWSTVWVTTFWAYLNELTQAEQSKRLYGMIGGGGVAGGLVGNLLVWQLVRPFGPSVLMFGCAAATVIVGLLIWRTEWTARQPGAAISRRETARVVEKPKGNAAIEGAKLVAASRYLIAITMIVFLYEVVSQILDYQYASAAEALEGQRATQAFFGLVGTIVGVVSVVTQFFLVSFIMRRFGLSTALLVLPVAMAVASGIYLAVPVLAAAALLTISDNAFSYSIGQTARETLFVPMDADVKYKARAFANMFVQRVGKGAAIMMALGLSALPTRLLSVLALLVIAVWIPLAVYSGRRFAALTREEPSPGGVPVPSSKPL